MQLSRWGSEKWNFQRKDLENTQKLPTFKLVCLLSQSPQYLLIYRISRPVISKPHPATLTSCLNKCHTHLYVPPSTYLTILKWEIEVILEQSSSQTHSSEHQPFQVIDRPWRGGRSNWRQREQAVTDLTPMERWQKESTRNQPYHHIEAVAYKGKDCGSAGHWKENACL